MTLTLTKLIVGGRIGYLWGRHNVEKAEIGGIIARRIREIREWHTLSNIFFLRCFLKRMQNKLENPIKQIKYIVHSSFPRIL